MSNGFTNRLPVFQWKAHGDVWNLFDSIGQRGGERRGGGGEEGAVVR